jgi:hypothetical protein
MNDAHRCRGRSRLAAGEEYPVHGFELRSEGLAAQDADLMAKDQDFQVLGTLIRAPAYEPAREAPHDEGQEEEHRDMVEGDRRFRHASEFPTPTPPWCRTAGRGCAGASRSMFSSVSVASICASHSAIWRR